MTRTHLAAIIALTTKDQSLTAQHIAASTGVHIRKVQHTLRHLYDVGILEITKTRHTNVFYKVKNEKTATTCSADAPPTPCKLGDDQ